MSKVYIYRKKDNTVTIYYGREFPDAKGIPVFEYDGEIPSGAGVLKTDGVSLYREVIPEPEPIEPEPSAEDVLNVLLGVSTDE